MHFNGRQIFLRGDDNATHHDRIRHPGTNLGVCLPDIISD